ncbi:unnamed protein product, partial [Caenorhabditis brenneri]
PWDIELAGKMRTEDESQDEKKMEDEMAKVNTEQKVCCLTMCHNALCIRRDVKNHQYNPKNKGSKKRCNLLFNPRHGLYRCFRNGQLGNWYKHEFRDDRRNKRFDPKTKPSKAWYTLFAPQAIRVDDPVQTRVNEQGKVEVTVDFVFNPDIFESPENREIRDWNIRRKGIRRKAHFWNRYLGVVEFYISIAEFILKTVEQYKLTHPQQPEVLKSTPIVVTVVASPRKHYEYYAEEYPKRGLFVANRTKVIKYKGGGPVLFDYTKDD